MYEMLKKCTKVEIYVRADKIMYRDIILVYELLKLCTSCKLYVLKWCFYVLGSIYVSENAFIMYKIVIMCSKNLSNCTRCHIPAQAAS